MTKFILAIGIIIIINHALFAQDNVFVQGQIKPEYFKPYVIKHIKFSFNNGGLFKSSFEFIDKMYWEFSFPKSNIMLILSHTDDVGSERYNLRLTQKRNEQILNYFSKKGYDMTNIKTMACGETLPISSNNTPEGQAQNRRIEVVILPDTTMIDGDPVFFYKSLDKKHNEFYQKKRCKTNNYSKYSIHGNDFISVKGYNANSLIRIYSISGKLIYQQQTNPQQIDISMLQKGIYYLLIQTNFENRAIFQFTKQ